MTKISFSIRHVVNFSFWKLNSSSICFMKNSLMQIEYRLFKFKIIDKNVFCYKWKTKTKTNFQKWWMKINWYIDNVKKSIKFKNKYNMIWNSVKLIHQWNQYIKIAKINSEIFKIVFCKCQKIFFHFVCEKNNNDMNKYLFSKSCIKITTKIELKILTKKNYRQKINRLS